MSSLQMLFTLDIATNGIFMVIFLILNKIHFSSGFSSRARCAMMKIYDPKQSKIFDWTDDLMGAFRQVDKRTQPPMADVSSRGRGLLIQYQGYPFYDSVSMVFTAYKGGCHPRLYNITK